MDFLCFTVRSPPTGVATSCVYSLGLDTPVELVYSAGQFPDSQPAWRTGPGDGTVTLDSAMACTDFLTRCKINSHKIAFLKAK